MTQTFVHLHTHSEYSLADGIVRLKPLAERVAAYAQPAVALSDLSNLYGMVKFYRACVQNGVKPLIACDVWVESPLDHKPGPPGPSPHAHRLKLFCQNQQGYRHLCKLLSQAFLRGPKHNKIVIDWHDLKHHAAGLLAVLDDQAGPLVAALATADGDTTQAAYALQPYQELFGDRLYVEISRIGRAAEADYIQQVGELSVTHAVPLVATNRVGFIESVDFEAHEIRVCINEGRVLDDSRRPRLFTAQQYLRSSEEMLALFADLPQAIENSVEIAKRCNLFLDFTHDHLPHYPGIGERSADELLREQSAQGLCKRLGLSNLDQLPAAQQQYAERMQTELGVIAEMGFPGYFLIVADFIQWSKQNDIPVGPGRGSGAGSLVAWATGITELDPIRYGLLFERFLNPQRVSLPDFDIDFCVEGRDRVIEYVAEQYGRAQVAQIITFGSLAAKAVVRDVGRVMGMPYGFVDSVAKLIPYELGITLQKALQQEEVLKSRYQNEADIRELLDRAMQLEGITRNVGTHAGGVVIAPEPLTEYTPLYSDTGPNQVVTQLDKDDLESIGLVKFDFLGLTTLTQLNLAVQMADQQRRAQNQPPLDLANLALDDADTYKLIQMGKTTAIFQLESRGMRELVVRLRPDAFDDWVALLALFRPGPLQSGMVDDFINRKHGREPVRYPHADLTTVLGPTHGVIVYQEQVMQIAQVLADFSLGDADLLRRAMGKKKPEEMAKQRALFVHGATQRGVTKQTAESIFSLMEKFAEYGFNKSHSVAYALVSYHTAWLKTHYPAAFMAATLSTEMDDTDKVVVLLADATELGLKVLPPDINQCDYRFKPLDSTRILYGLGAIKGIGENVIQSIVAERTAHGAFHDLFEFCSRLDKRLTNKRTLEALIKCGAMDALGAHRAALLQNMPNAIQAAGQQQTNKEVGQSDLLGAADDAPLRVESRQPAAKWSEQQLLEAEKEALGLYLSGHPYNRFRAELSQFTVQDLTAMDLSKPTPGVFAGLVISVRVLKTRRGKMAFAVLDNAQTRVELILYSEGYARYTTLLKKDIVLLAQGELSADDAGGNQMRVANLYDLDTLRQNYLRRIHLRLYEQQTNRDLIQQLRAALSESQGGRVTVVIVYQRCSGETGRLKLGDDWQLRPEPSVLQTLHTLLGEANVTCDYDVDLCLNARLAEPTPRFATAARYG